MKMKHSVSSWLKKVDQIGVPYYFTCLIKLKKLKQILNVFLAKRNVNGKKNQFFSPVDQYFSPGKIVHS